MIIEPTYLGRPLYPGGLPLRTDNITVENRTVRQIFLDGISEGGETNYSADDDETLKSYVVYYMQAPIWDIDEPLIPADLMKLTLTELIGKCMEHGLDPF